VARGEVRKRHLAADKKFSSIKGKKGFEKNRG